MSYPRVLLVHMTRVYQNDAVNLMVRNLFGEWPKEHLAQLYTGDYVGIGNFCGHYFQLGAKERRLGWLFYKLKPKAMSAASGVTSAQSSHLSHSRLRSLVARAVSRFIALGYWDMLFKVHLSDALIEFVKDFKPDIMYTQGYSLSFTALVLDLARYFRVPVCYFPMDDWHSYLFAGSRAHLQVEILATELARSASIRFALGPKMAEALTLRYGIPFECLYHADDPKRFAFSRQAAGSSENVFVIGYAGSLYLGRHVAFQDLLKACSKLNRPFRIDVYCESVPVDLPSELCHSPEVRFLPLPDHYCLPEVLASCDALFLPESFEEKYKSAIELSLSTKAHLYMMSRKPILVYGPTWSGTVDYAKRFGWGVVVDERDVSTLLDGMREVSGPHAEELVTKAYNVAMLNHDIDGLHAKIQERFSDVVKIV